MRRDLIIAVFISGMTTLAVELAAARLLGNVFGASNLVWASIIGLILIYLTAGYFLGGAWADRSPTYRTFYTILLWAAVLIALVPVVSRPVLRAAASAFDTLQMGALFGAFAAVLALLSIPITLLGTASPFAIRLAAQDTKHLGSIAGRIYGISTLGSFLGTFLPVLVLIPIFGTYRTFLVISAVLLLVALFGLSRACGWRAALPYLWMLILVAALGWRGLPGSDKPTPGLVYETESAYNYIQVLELRGFRYLRLNEGQGVHSVYHPQQLAYYGPWEMVLAAPFFNPAPYDPAEIKSMAIVGLAAGTTARQATAVYGEIAIDGIEIDPRIVDVGRKYFDMNQPNLNVIVQDGRWGLEHSQRLYQIISIDAYRPPYIPWHLTTREFFAIVRQKLTPDGVLVINVGRSPTDRRLISALSSTLQTEFSSLHVMDIPDSFNSIMFATVQLTDPENMLHNLVYLAERSDTHPLLLFALQRTLENLQPAPAAGTVFTDDMAPVEWITNDMILDYLFFNPTEALQ
ncbi:MAG: fused MFS/spermidine synthase [Anaerolineaceae bacterium]|nr:fused MFS/spermidine synthase [Anaerolineaceae bacterium]